MAADNQFQGCAGCARKGAGAGGRLLSDTGPVSRYSSYQHGGTDLQPPKHPRLPLASRPGCASPSSGWGKKEQPGEAARPPPVLHDRPGMCRGGLPALRRGRGPFQLPAARGGGQGVSQMLCFAGRRRRRRCWTAPERDAAPMFRRRRRCEWGAGESRRDRKSVV